MTIKKLSLLGLMSACLIAQMSHSSAFRKLIPTVLGSGALLIGLEKGFDQLFEPDNIFKKALPKEIEEITTYSKRSTLSEENQERIKTIGRTYGKDVRVLDLNPEYDSVAEGFPFVATKNKIIVPPASRIALEKGHLHKTYLTPEEVEAFVHIAAKKSSSSFRDSIRCIDIPAAFIARDIALLKNKKYGMAGFLAGYLTSKYITTLLLLLNEDKAHLLPTSQMALAAASGYRKNGEIKAAEKLEKYAQELRAQGK